LLLRTQIVVDVVQDTIQIRQIAAPRRHRLRPVDLQRLQPELQHPRRLVLVRRYLAYDAFIQTRPRLERRRPAFRDEAVLVFLESQSGDRLVLWHDLCPFVQSGFTALVRRSPARGTPRSLQPPALPPTRSRPTARSGPPPSRARG